MTRVRTPRGAERAARQAVRRRLVLGDALETAMAIEDVYQRARTILALSDAARKRLTKDEQRRAELAIKRPRVRLAAFWQHVGEPPRCGPADTWRAREFYNKLLSASEHPDMPDWSRKDKAALRALTYRWKRRANGADRRFMTVGNVPGRLQRGVEGAVSVEEVIWPLEEMGKPLTAE